MGKENFKTIVINTIGNLGKEELSISILAPTFEKNVENIPMIDADAYRLAYQLKKAQVFAIFIRDLEFQVEKEVKPETNSKIVIPEEYHDFLDLFSKKDLNTLSAYQKYDHKIILEEEQKHSFAFLYKMSL